MGYFIEIALCGMVVLVELLGVFIILALIQLISYRILGINLYKKVMGFTKRILK